MKTAILITTFLRDNLLKKTIDSIIEYAPIDTEIIIGDQGYITEEKRKFYAFYRKDTNYYELPFNCGLSYARNELVQKALTMGCKYVILASDSFIWNKKTQIERVYPALEKYDLIGLHLNGVHVYWVGKLDLYPGKYFELEFYDRYNSKYDQIGDIKVLPCDIVHNFWIAKAETLLKWDIQLPMAEHEDYFWNYKKAGFKVGWTPDISADYIQDRSGKCGKYRAINWNLGIERLKRKYNLQQWINYKNVFLGKNGTSI